MVRVEVPEPPEIVELVRVAVGPLRARERLRVTVPVKAYVGAMIMVELAEFWAWTVRLVGVAEIVKSGEFVSVTVTSMVAVCVIVPLVPVTVTA